MDQQRKYPLPELKFQGATETRDGATTVVSTTLYVSLRGADPIALGQVVARAASREPRLALLATRSLFGCAIGLDEQETAIVLDALSRLWGKFREHHAETLAAWAKIPASSSERATEPSLAEGEAAGTLSAEDEHDVDASASDTPPPPSPADAVPPMNGGPTKDRRQLARQGRL